MELLIDILNFIIAAMKSTSLIYWMGIIMIMLLCIKFYNALTIAKLTCISQMEGKTIVITGSNSGIGYWTAFHCALQGARVILACRRRGAAEEAKEKLIRETGNKNIDVYVLDVASFKSVREFVEEFKTKEERLDVLINNAGAGVVGYELTVDNLQLTWQTNVFGPFLLTNLLLDLLKKSSPSRIIFVSSKVHLFNNFEMGVWNCDKHEYNSVRAYFNTKFAEVLLSNYLAKSLEGSGVTSNSLHPGVAITRLTRAFETNFLNTIYEVALWFFGNTVEECSRTSARLAIDDSLANVNGRYFANCEETKCHNLAKDMVLSKNLWEACEEIVGLKEENEQST